MASTGGWLGRIAVKFEPAARDTRVACGIAASVGLGYSCPGSITAGSDGALRFTDRFLND